MIKTTIIYARFVCDGRVRTLPVLFHGNDMDSDFLEFMKIKAEWSPSMLAKAASAVRSLFEISERSDPGSSSWEAVDWNARIQRLRARSLMDREVRQALAAASMFINFICPSLPVRKARRGPSHIAGEQQHAAFNPGLIDVRPSAPAIFRGECL